jgi:hypothetical protein
VSVPFCPKIQHENLTSLVQPEVQLKRRPPKNNGPRDLPSVRFTVRGSRECTRDRAIIGNLHVNKPICPATTGPFKDTFTVIKEERAATDVGGSLRIRLASPQSKDGHNIWLRSALQTLKNRNISQASLASKQLSPSPFIHNSQHAIS